MLKLKILEETTTFHMCSPTITFGWEAHTRETDIMEFGIGMMAPPSPSTDGILVSQTTSQQEAMSFVC